MTKQSRHLGRTLAVLMLFQLVVLTSSPLWAQEPGTPEHRERVERILNLSGDMAELDSRLEGWKQVALSVVGSMNTPALPAVQTELDKLINPQRNADQIYQRFRGYEAESLENLERWASSADTQAFNKALFGSTGEHESVDFEALPAKRQELLNELSEAMALRGRANVVRIAYPAMVKSLLSAMDPQNTKGINFNGINGPGQIPQAQVLGEWVAPALSSFSDAQLEEQLAFAKSRTGYYYFQNLASSYFSYAAGQAWRQSVVETAGTYALLVPEPMSEEQIDQAVARADYLLNQVGMRTVTEEAYKLLKDALHARPDDSKILALLGQAAIYRRPGPRANPELGELRSRFASADSFAEAEGYLNKAIDLDPSNDRAYVFLGFAKFQYGDDEQALANYQKAVALGSTEQWLQINLADYSQHIGDLDEAIELYLEVIAAEERSAGVHFAALQRSRHAYMAADRAEDYTALGRRFLSRYPEDKDFRLVYGEHLLDIGGPASETIDVVAKVPPGWQDRWKASITARAMMLEAVEINGDSTSVLPGAKAKLDQAIAVFGSERAVIDALRTHKQSLQALILILRSREGSPDHATAVLGGAVYNRDTRFIGELVAMGADPNHVEDFFALERPLVWAVMTQEPELMKVLLAHGADSSLKSRDGLTLREHIGRYPSDSRTDALLRVLDEHEAGSRN